MSCKTKMTKFPVTILAEVIKADLKPGVNHNSCFNGISTDSRTTKPGDCFFAIKGRDFNGEDFLDEAFKKGAVCAVVNKDNTNIDFIDKTIFRVSDTIKALGQLAKYYRLHNRFKVVAVTGSVGKTTTRHITHHVLSQHYRCCQAQKNFNNNIGLPITLLQAQPQDEIIIAELGSSKPGEISYLTDIARPDIAVVINVYPAHLAGFGNIQTIIEEKLSISEGLTKKGSFLINGDFKQLTSFCREKYIRFITFGKSDSCEIQAKNIRCHSFASEFTINGIRISLPLPGLGNLENALAAWAVCSRLGVNINDFADALKTLQPVNMRTELHRIGTLTVLNDCYNANPASMRNALNILAGINSNSSGRRVFICGEMAELAEQSEHYHIQLGSFMTQAGIQLVIAIGDSAKIAAEAARENAEYKLHIKCFKDTDSACNKLQEFIKQGDIILVKGSRTAKLENIVKKLNELFVAGGFV